MSHLTNDEHVLALDDALLDFGLHALANLTLVVVAEGRVDVAVAGGDGRLHSSLDHVAGEVGGLQRVRQVGNIELAESHRSSSEFHSALVLMLNGKTIFIHFLYSKHTFHWVTFAQCGTFLLHSFIHSFS